MKVYFSASTLSFTPGSWRDDGTYTDETWPSDAIEMSQDEIDKYWKVPTPEGKILGASDGGRPTWVDAPKPSQAELVAQAEVVRSNMQHEAEASIKPLERARSLGIATPNELALLTEWERYSVYLMRVDTSLAPNIEWPQKPQ